MDRKKKITYAVIGIVGGLILIAAGIAIGKFYFQKSPETLPEAPKIEEVADITWQEPEEYERLYLFVLNDLYPGMDTEKARENITYYKVGTVNKGKYAGGEVVNIFVTPEGPSFTDYIFRVIRKDNKNYLITKYSDDTEGVGLDKNSVILDKYYTISDLDFPDTITVNNVNMTKSEDAVNVFFSLNGVKKVGSDSQVGDVYTNIGVDGSNTSWFSVVKNCFFVKAKDSTVRVYTYTPNFVRGEDSPQVTWSSGAENSQSYAYKGTGPCGTNDCFNISNVSQSALKVGGKTSSGQNVYLYTDSNAYELKNFYNNEYYVPEGETKLSYSKFVADRPIFFWKDSFGRFVMFKSLRFVSPGECGKPAVYLYPKNPINVLVKVDPSGGITKSDPEYENGWNVLALPSGKLFDWVQSKIYPYLFWEGDAEDYQIPDKGFVVAKEEVSALLSEKLAALGLIDQEIADFKEFWVPKMENAPYYFVTFLNQNCYEKMAPMEINPQPDTVIRVMMDFRPLDKPIKVESLEIKTPVRRGFTVVEWGGMLNGKIK